MFAVRILSGCDLIHRHARFIWAWFDIDALTNVVCGEECVDESFLVEVNGDVIVVVFDDTVVDTQEVSHSFFECDFI